MRIVLAGQPNVGKSSLLNRLVGEELAIVTDIPGTTRDTIRETINVGGVPAHIVDTAGLRDPRDPVERLGIERTWTAIEEADLVLLVVDAEFGETAADREILNRLPKTLQCVRVMNKIDLIGQCKSLDTATPSPVIWLSAKTGEGIDLLRDLLLETTGRHSSGESLFLARERHLECLKRAQRHLEQAGQHMRDLDLLAEELRLAQDALAAIGGEFTSDDLLGEIFSRFCIGK
jgi:tRNA modification GTPase